jgi:hypothetical protein
MLYSKFLHTGRVSPNVSTMNGWGKVRSSTLKLTELKDSKMDKLSLSHLSYSGRIGAIGIEKIVDTLQPFTYEFTFGKTYLIKAPIGSGGWALSWIIGGSLLPDSGLIQLGTHNYLSQAKALAWCARKSQIRGLIFSNLTIKEQVARSLQKRRGDKPSIEEIVELFKLTPQRFERPITQLSHEAWRASCAIGYAANRKIFCFPHMEYVRPNFVEEYSDLWLADILSVLKAAGSLIIFPSTMPKSGYKIFDDVVDL